RPPTLGGPSAVLRAGATESWRCPACLGVSVAPARQSALDPPSRGGTERAGGSGSTGGVGAAGTLGPESIVAAGPVPEDQGDQMGQAPDRPRMATARVAAAALLALSLLAGACTDGPDPLAAPGPMALSDVGPLDADVPPAEFEVLPSVEQ